MVLRASRKAFRAGEFLVAIASSKEVVSTLGGVIFLLATLIVSLFYIGKYPEMIPVMIGMFGFGLIGLIDDSMKMLKKQNEGMTPSQKMLGQIVVAVAVVLYLQLVMKTGTEIHIPFVNGTYNVGIFYYVIAAIMILGRYTFSLLMHHTSLLYLRYQLPVVTFGTFHQVFCRLCFSIRSIRWCFHQAQTLLPNWEK